MRALAVLLVCLFSAVGAAELPALHSVTNVAADDTLNIRTEPNPGAQVIGTLTPNAKNIEVVHLSDNGRWGLINLGEKRGWASLAYLSPQSSPPFAEQSLSCYGTEPFWSLTATDKMIFTQLSNPPEEFYVTTRTQASGRADRYALGAGGMAGLATALITRQICSDGMSDQTFGLEVDLLIDTGEAQTYLAGCCSLSP